MAVTLAVWNGLNMRTMLMNWVREWNRAQYV